MAWIGKSVRRQDAIDKVTGEVKYTADYISPDLLYAKMVTSTHGHAIIIDINTTQAEQFPGVRKVITGSDIDLLVGEEIHDRPILAVGKVRYYGEPVAVVIADSLKIASLASRLVNVTYSPLPVVNSPKQAFQHHAPLIHENLGTYKKNEGIYPVPGTNICNHTKIRKGNMDQGWKMSDIIQETHISFPPSDHAAIETRTTTVEIKPDGHVTIHSSSQAPFTIKKLVSATFGINQGQITVHTPFVGGAYGGKSAIQLEYIAYCASRAVGGRKVKMINTREEDFTTSPCHIGLDATVKIGCDSEGHFHAMELFYLWDGGAYSDKAVDICRAGAIDCTGPYHVEHVWCDSLCLYTNHPYATAFRGFGHPELTFAIERAVDELADKLSMDPVELRQMNAIRAGQTTPTQAILNSSKIGDVSQCLEKVKTLIEWDKGTLIEVDDVIVRAKGISCFWKTSNIKPNASSGAILTFNEDGTVNLSCGVVEIGTGSRSVLAQIAAERLGMDVHKIAVTMNIDTNMTPEHYKTVASRGLWMAGRAVLEAADDALHQLFNTASQVLRVPVSDLEVKEGYIYSKNEPLHRLAIADLAYGFTYENGNTIGSQVIGRGNYVLTRLTLMDPETGKGSPGPDWTVGAQAVEVEWNKRDFSYKLLRAATVIDAGTIINPMLAEGQVRGGMHMGLSFASREGFVFTDTGIVLNNQFRTYKVLRYGENPEYLVDFVVTPSRETAYGLRGIGEHGVIGMPGALGNCLSRAAEVPINHLPITPELIWRVKTGSER